MLRNPSTFDSDGYWVDYREGYASWNCKDAFDFLHALQSNCWFSSNKTDHDIELEIFALK